MADIINVSINDRTADEKIWRVEIDLANSDSLMIFACIYQRVDITDSKIKCRSFSSNRKRIIWQRSKNSYESKQDRNSRIEIQKSFGLDHNRYLFI